MQNSSKNTVSRKLAEPRTSYMKARLVSHDHASHSCLVVDLFCFISLCLRPLQPANCPSDLSCASVYIKLCYVWILLVCKIYLPETGLECQKEKKSYLRRVNYCYCLFRPISWILINSEIFFLSFLRTTDICHQQPYPTTALRFCILSNFFAGWALQITWTFSSSSS